MSCRVELVADCGDVSGLSRALYFADKEDPTWLSRCAVSLSSCGSLLCIAHRNRLCVLTAQWISATESNTFIISWNGNLSAEATAVLALPICSSSLSSQKGADWICIAVGYASGEVSFLTEAGDVLLTERLDDKPVRALSCHTGSFGSDADDVHVLFQGSVCVLAGSILFHTLRYAKAQLARVQAGVTNEFALEGKNILSRKWLFVEQDVVHDAAVVGLELKNTYDHLLAASTFGGYDTWYRSVPPHNTLIVGAGARPYIGFHYALEGGNTPPLQDVARAVASKIKSALPGWLGGGTSKASTSTSDSKLKEERLSMRSGVSDVQRQASACVLSPDRRLAALTDNLGRIAVLHVQRATLIRLFKGYRDSQCAFLQVFEQDTKRGPTLSNVKDTRKATFLIIYNPKKGLIDIRLMQRGTRVAAFTATKYGKLLYNTNGLVGSESNYSSKKLNIPTFPCVLIDPDGKIKRFVIPFHNALEGENSQRSKDLHLIKEFKNIFKQQQHGKDELSFEILKTAGELKTPDLKKVFLELISGNSEVSPEVVISCLELFQMEISAKEEMNPEEIKLHNFCKSLKCITSFFLQLNKREDEHDMDMDISKGLEKIDCDSDHTLKTECEDKDGTMSKHEKGKEVSILCNLTEVDTSILERLLELAQENYSKDAHLPKVTFADNKKSSNKDFVTAFDLENSHEHLSLKLSLQNSRISTLASYIFKSMYTQNYPKPEMFGHIIMSCNMNPKDIVKLFITYWMDMPLNEINLDVVKNSISILFHICQSSKEATCIVYNEVSPWWQHVRDVLVDMPCPLRTMIVAMVCRVVGQNIEQCAELNSSEEAWVSVTTENAKWSLLVGKLEDIAMLSIVLQFRGSIKGKSLPKLNLTDLQINLKYIYNRGKGAVSELIAKWLCSKGVTAEAICANEVLELQINDSASQHKEPLKPEDESGYLMSDCDRICVEENPAIFKWLNLLKKQFPCSASTDNLIANMCWEYAAAWQKEVTDMDKLTAIISCLKNIRNVHICLGLCMLIWVTYMKELFESICRLVNKVGKLPKERLCSQDVGLNDKKMLDFLLFTTQYLEQFLCCVNKKSDSKKPTLLFEKIWDESIPALVEVAQATEHVNIHVLNINYQIACAIYYQCNFNIKLSKPLNVLFDCELPYVFSAIATREDGAGELNLHSEGKLTGQRMKFLSKLIAAALELISCEDSVGAETNYRSAESWAWMERIYSLAELWGVDSDFIRREQMVGLYKLGYDSLAEDAMAAVRAPTLLLPPLLLSSAQRLKRCLDTSRCVSDALAALPPELAIHLQTLESDSTISANVCLRTTASVLRHTLLRAEDEQGGDGGGGALQQNARLARLLIYGCDILQDFHREAGVEVDMCSTTAVV